MPGSLVPHYLLDELFDPIRVHAGFFETSLLHALHPELVHLDRLPARATHPSVDPGGDTMGPQRHDPEHPLWGIFGPDPREIDIDETDSVRTDLVSWIAGMVSTRLTASPD